MTDIQNKNIKQLKKYIEIFEQRIHHSVYDYKKYFLSFILGTLFLILNPVLRKLTQMAKELLFDYNV